MIRLFEHVQKSIEDETEVEELEVCDSWTIHVHKPLSRIIKKN